MLTVAVSVCRNKGYTQAKFSPLNSPSKEYMLCSKFNFSVGGAGDERWGWDWKQAKLTVPVYKTIHFLKLKKQIIRGHGVDGVAHCDPTLRAQLRSPQHGELERVHADQMSWEWVSADCVRLLMACCPALRIVWNSFWELSVLHTSKDNICFYLPLI